MAIPSCLSDTVLDSITFFRTYVLNTANSHCRAEPTVRLKFDVCLLKMWQHFVLRRRSYAFSSFPWWAFVCFGDKLSPVPSIIASIMNIGNKQTRRAFLPSDAEVWFQCMRQRVCIWKWNGCLVLLKHKFLTQHRDNYGFYCRNHWLLTIKRLHIYQLNLIIQLYAKRMFNLHPLRHIKVSLHITKLEWLDLCLLCCHTYATFSKHTP